MPIRAEAFYAPGCGRCAGVLSPPPIAVDGELVFPSLPSAARLREELARRLDGS